MKKYSDLFKTSLIYFIVLALFVGVRILASLNILPDAQWVDYVFSAVIQVGILFIIPLLLYMLFFKKKPKEVFVAFKYKKLSLKVVLLCIVLGVCCYIINLYVSTFFTLILSLLGYSSSGASASVDYDWVWLVTSIVFSCILPAICEEFVHRGMLIKGFSKKGAVWAIAMSSVLFGLMHLNITQCGYAIVMGVIMGFMAVACQSIIPAIIIHFINNFISTYLAFSQANNLPVGTFVQKMTSVASNNLVLYFISSLIILIIVVYLVKLIISEILKEVMKDKLDKARKIYALNYLRTEVLEGTEAAQNMFNDGKLGIVCDELIEIEGMSRVIRIKIPFEYFFGDGENVVVKNHKFKDYIFLIASLILGSLVTIFTFIWGLL